MGDICASSWVNKCTFDLWNFRVGAGGVVECGRMEFAFLLSRQSLDGWKPGRVQEWMLSHLLYPGSTLWHSPASGTNIPRNSARTWTWGLVPLQDLVFCEAGGLNTHTVFSCCCPTSVLFGIIHFCPHLCWSVPHRKKMNIQGYWNLNSNIQPSGPDELLTIRILPLFLQFLNQTSPQLSHAIAVQAKKIIIKNCLCGLRMRWNFSRKDQALGFLLQTI